jgi:hypothetical protein
LSGLAWFEVYPAANKKILNNTNSWQSVERKATIDSSDVGYSSTNEFIVIVHSDDGATFSIFEKASTKCSTFLLSKPLKINV